MRRSSASESMRADHSPIDPAPPPVSYSLELAVHDLSHSCRILRAGARTSADLAREGTARCWGRTSRASAARPRRHRRPHCRPAGARRPVPRRLAPPPRAALAGNRTRHLVGQRWTYRRCLRDIGVSEALYQSGPQAAAAPWISRSTTTTRVVGQTERTGTADLEDDHATAPHLDDLLGHGRRGRRRDGQRAPRSSTCT